MRSHHPFVAALVFTASLAGGLPGCHLDDVEMTEAQQLPANVACVAEAPAKTTPGNVTGRYHVIDHHREQWNCDRRLGGYEAGSCDDVDRGVEGAEVLACRAGDLACDEPLDATQTSADGTAAVNLLIGEKGWDGYLQVDAGDGYWGGIYLRVPAEAPTSAGYEELAVQPLTIASLFRQATGYEIPADRGILRADLLDCSGLPLEGVVVELSSPAEIGYEVAAAPSFARETTSSAGRVWAFDVEPGLHSVTVRDQATGIEIAVAENVPFKQGVVTRLVLSPSR